MIEKFAVNFTSGELAMAVYVIILSIIGFIMMGIDKTKAKNGDWRVREATLMTIAFLGGAIGVLCGMLIFKHKINKSKFRLGIPLLYLLNRAIEIVIASYLG
ncbi:DUF1294 domain-containing protein [Brassicibacter mesophilus]|uniref:DUF1294 domain-containing protein n=1 Tax=Brassicibacter mesophilus TaxID=745119 RepID=UPI003D1E98AD